jgi:hypothetical protein
MLACTVLDALSAPAAAGFWTQWHEPKYLKPPALACKNPVLVKQNQSFAVFGRKLD